MGNLYETLADAEGGEAMGMLAREFGLTPQQTQAAATALLPAIASGLKRATATPEGLGELFGLMGRQQDLHTMYEDLGIALAPQGRAAGNDVLSLIFGSPDVSRAVADQAQRFSGIPAGVLKKLLPVLAGILISGLMGRKSGQAAPQAPAPGPDLGGALRDVLGQIFGREPPGSPGAPPGLPPQMPAPGRQPIPLPTDTGEQPGPGGDLLGYIVRELERGIREGRIKPVIIEGGPIQVPLPGGREGPLQFPVPPGQPEPRPSGPGAPGGDILGQVLRDLLGGLGGPARAPQRGPSPQIKDLSDMSRQLGFMDGVGAAVFGDRLEVGREVEEEHLESIERVLERFSGTRRG